LQLKQKKKKSPSMCPSTVIPTGNQAKNIIVYRVIYAA
jgi:hypothetical protein